jgi:hypothetical protein
MENNNALNQGMSKINTLQKDLFKQKGGTFGLLIIAILVILLVFNLPAILAWTTSLLKLILVVAGIAGILFVFFDKRVRLIVSTYYMIFIQKTIGIIVKIDPVAICRDKIRNMQKRIALIEDRMGKLNGVIKDLGSKVDQKKEDLQVCFDRKKIAEKKGLKDAMLLEDRQSVRIADLVKDYMELHESTKKWYNVLSKVAEKANFTVEDAINELDAKEEKYNIVKLSHSTFKSAMSVIQGDPDELAIYNQAFNFINEDIMAKIGEMDRVLNSGGLLDRIDIDNEVMSLKGSDLMKKYDELGIDAIFETMNSKPSTRAMDVFNNASTVTTSTHTMNSTKPKYF